MNKQKKNKNQGLPTSSGNPAYVAAVQGLRFGNAAGIHKQAKYPNRAKSKRDAIEESKNY